MQDGSLNNLALRPVQYRIVLNRTIENQVLTQDSRSLKFINCSGNVVFLWVGTVKAIEEETEEDSHFWLQALTMKCDLLSALNSYQHP